MKTEDEKKAIRGFCKQYAWLIVVFEDYRILYEGAPDRWKLLQEVAAEFFQKLNLILVQHILLNMSKLTDPAHSRQDDNLTVEYIVKLVGEEQSKELGLDELSGRIHAIRPYIKEARNKVVAHLDKNTLLSRKIVGEIPKSVLDSFWDNLRELVDRVHKHYFGRILGDVVNPTSAEDLVEALKRAVDWGDYFHKNPLLASDRLPKMRYKDA